VPRDAQNRFLKKLRLMTTTVERVLRFDAFELDLRAGELRKRGAKLPLQGQPVLVLGSLLKRAGELVTRDELRSEIWPDNTFVDFDHSLHNAIARIRETLGDRAKSPRYVETLPRRGYRFIAHVDAINREPLASSHAETQRTGAGRIQSLAVLPLEDHSCGPRQEYFADGMTEALITSLAQIKALRVISRTSAMQYKGARKSLPQIARELKVDAVIEGSVLRSGDRVRIAAQLIDAANDEHLWADSYERDFRDILALQSDIATQVANEVRIILTPEEKARLGGSRQVDPGAHELYLKARYHWNKRNEDSVRKALNYFQEAIDRDPTFARGYVGLADCYNILGYYNALPPNEVYPKARAAARQAMALDASLAEPHASLGVVKRDFEWDWCGAQAEFERSIELNPGYVEAHHWRSTLLRMLGRHEEALVEKKRALAMDPLSVVINTDLARMFYFNREYDRAIEQFRAALDLDPSFSSAHLWLAQAYEQKGLFDEAIFELQTGKRLSGADTYALARWGHGYAIAGKRDDARQVLVELNEVAKEKYVSPYDLAMIRAGLQEKEEAFRLLHEAFEQRSLWLGYLQVEPQWDPLRSDRRVHDLVQSIGLPGPG
jgi:TolB-like protein/Flp pilus assembly protein TadD